MAISRALSAMEAMYRETDTGSRRSIKGVVQLIKLLLFIVAALVIIGTVADRNIGLLLSGLGAMSAVLLLIFKDTILGFVAGVQLATNDMLRVGDWITMPNAGADGDVIDITLYTVKVRNFDKTIVTIPTWKLISESYQNWRGMAESGGRRIKRALSIDAASVHFLDQDEIDRLGRFRLLSTYLQDKHSELMAWNRSLGEAGEQQVNRRRLTNLGTFRAYCTAYLKEHPRIHREMTCMVRQLATNTQGIPLELYCFTATTAWGDYEDIQGDIFDHLFALLPEFGLTLYQQPAGTDFRAGLAACRAVTHESGQADD
jgi:miniconductance mechanosensitive channel